MGVCSDDGQDDRRSLQPFLSDSLSTTIGRQYIYSMCIDSIDLSSFFIIFFVFVRRHFRRRLVPYFLDAGTTAKFSHNLVFCFQLRLFAPHLPPLSGMAWHMRVQQQPTTLGTKSFMNTFSAPLLFFP